MVRLPDIERPSVLRLSRDKLNKLAHSVTDALAALETVKFVEDRNAIRLEVRRILEGTQEWDILYRKYYNEEVKKLGI